MDEVVGGAGAEAAKDVADAVHVAVVELPEGIGQGRGIYGVALFEQVSDML